LLPNTAALLTGEPVVYTPGGVIIGRDVVVIRDVSNSMHTAIRRDRLQRLIDSLESKRMHTSQVTANGFGVTANNSQNLLNAINKAVAENLNIDSFYAFSDFEIVPDSEFRRAEKNYWKNDGAGYQRLERLLKEGGARLYLGTVKHAPLSELAAIARRSGGGVVHTAP
jgi:hypothetical protein